jgi:hypothetical protein
MKRRCDLSPATDVRGAFCSSLHHRAATRQHASPLSRNHGTSIAFDPCLGGGTGALSTQEFNHEKAPERFRARLRERERPGTSLPETGSGERVESGAKASEIRPSCRPNKTVISKGYPLAGAPGFEPGDGGIKIRCLTTWLRPNVVGLPPYRASSGGRNIAARSLPINAEQ